MLDILYEDRDIAVLNKPAGISVHPSAHAPREPALTAEILKRWPEIKKVGDPPAGGLRPGIVHRLDKETSGVLVIAKTQHAFEYLKKQFQERRVQKTYLALVVGKMTKRQGEITMPIGRSKRFGRFIARPHRSNQLPVISYQLSDHRKPTTGNRMREAVTRWRVLREYREPSGDTLSLLEIRPETGRTHQIRVHLAAVGHPVVGDSLYGGKAAKKYRAALGRHFLHAESLQLALPDGKALRVEADLPKDLQEFLHTFA